MTPPETPPPTSGTPPFAVAGLSQGRVRLTARPAHGPADVERITRVLRRLRGLRDVGLTELRGDEAHFVLDLARPLPLAADLRTAFGRELLGCVRTADGFALELEPTPGDIAPAPAQLRAPLGTTHGGPYPGGYARPAPGPGGGDARTLPAGGGTAAPLGARPALSVGASAPSPVVAREALPVRATHGAPAARTESTAHPRRTGGRRASITRARVGVDQDRRCAVLTIDRDHVVRDAAGGLFRAFADDDRPLVGRALRDVVGPVLQPLMVDHLSAAWRGEPTAVTLRSPDGERAFELRFHPPRTRGLGASASIVAVDVTDEHEATSVARELEMVHETMLASSLIPTALIGTDGRWLRANPPFEALLGRRETVLIGRLASDLTQIDDRAREAYLRDRALRAGAPTFELEKRMVRADGGVIVVISRTAILREGDAVRGYVVHVVPEAVAEGLPRPHVPEERPRRRLLRRPGRAGGPEGTDDGSDA